MLNFKYAKCVHRNRQIIPSSKSGWALKDLPFLTELAVMGFAYISDTLSIRFDIWYFIVQSRSLMIKIIASFHNFTGTTLEETTGNFHNYQKILDTQVSAPILPTLVIQYVTGYCNGTLIWNNHPTNSFKRHAPSILWGLSALLKMHLHSRLNIWLQ